MGEENKLEVTPQEEEFIIKDIGGVLEAMNTMETYEVFDVVRDGKKLFSFRVKGLDDEEFEKCREQATKLVKDRRLGNLAVPQEFNSAKFNSLVIYTATHPEDKKSIWDNKELWKKANVVAGWQVIDKVMKRGEKEKCIELIESLSGYEEIEETLKNS